MFTAFHWSDWIDLSGYAVLTLWHVPAVRSMLIAPMGGVDATIPASDPSQSIRGLEHRAAALSGIPRDGFFVNYCVLRSNLLL